MNLGHFVLLCFLLLLTNPLRAEEEQDIIARLGTSSSQDRILAISIYCQENAYSRGRTRGKLNFLLHACYQIAARDRDQEFKEYLDFYSRVKEVMFVPLSDLYQSETKVLSLWKEALKYYRSVGDERFMAICQAQIGGSHFTLRHYGESIESLLNADELFQKVGYRHFPMMGRYLHDMSLIFYFFREYGKVVELMNASIQLPPHDRNKHIQRYNTLGAAYDHLNQGAKAEQAFTKTIETAHRYGDDIWVAIGSAYLARLYIDQGKYKAALQLFESTLQYAGDGQAIDNREYAEHLLGMAKCCIFLHDLAKAKAYLNKIKYKGTENTKERYIFGKAHQDVNYWLNYYDVKHRYYLALQKMDKAYFYSDSLYAFKYMIDSTFNKLEVQVAKNSIAVQKKQYQNDEREAVLKSKNRLLTVFYILASVVVVSAFLLFIQNRKVRSQNRLINQQMDALQKILNQKHVLLKELQHRVKNNLQHVISILEIQKESVDLTNIEEVIRENQNRIHSMALLHSKLNGTDEINMVKLEEYLLSLSSLVKDSYGNQNNVALLLDCKVETMTIDKALPLGMILVELISNSIKHAFENGNAGLINVEIVDNQTIQKYVLHYRDNGKGFDYHLKERKGLGIEIIKGLIDQLNGTVETNKAFGFDLKVYF